MIRANVCAPLVLWVIVLISCISTVLAESPRPLADSGSPYLRLHADDPVAWRVWSPDAMAEARDSNRLIFLSIGYYACHWCHVMQRESFQDAAVAAYLNRHFIPVKVDREVDTVLDAQMMRFMEATRGQGGWPLNVFLTPEGYPLVGAVYLPRDAFLEFLQRLQARWQNDAAGLAETAQAGWVVLQRPVQPGDGAGTAWQALPEAFADAVLSRADELAGGFGYQAKFPTVPQLRAALELAREPGHDELAGFLRLTLDAMRDGGLRDHVGEGFFRYTVDPQWQIPHFEKMLYDNAQLARLYLEAAQVLGEPRYRETGVATLRFIRRVMHSAQGDGYVASLSALDDRDVEGGYYLWEPDAIRRAAGDDWPLVELAWGLTLPRTLEAGYLPHLHGSTEALAARAGVERDRLAAAIENTERRLLERRASRHLPRDDKRLTAWNGLVLAAFASGAATGDAKSARAARGLLAWIRDELWREGVLERGVDARGRSLGAGVLADYAYVADGAVAWAREDQDADAWDFARDVVDAAWHRFHVEEEGGWVSDPAALLPGLGRVQATPDDVLPSATAMLLVSSRAVATYFGDETLLQRVEQARAVMAAEAATRPFEHASLIMRVPAAGIPGAVQ